MTLTPSLGPHLRLGVIANDPRWAVIITPSAGLAVEIQSVDGSARVPHFDRNSPDVFVAFAPGLVLAAGPFHVRVRDRLSRGVVTASTWEMALGVGF